MEFVTIHDLSRELNTPARVIRYRLINLIADGKLKEHDDFRRDDFKDDQHFVWKIHPVRFMQESHLKPDTKPLTAGNQTVDKPLSMVNQPGNNTIANGTDMPKSVTKIDTNIGDNADHKTADTSLAREMIDLLKEQIKIKDGQLKDQGEQLKENHELNLKLTGTMLQQAQEIKNLLRLTGGQSSPADAVTTGGSIVNESTPADAA